MEINIMRNISGRRREHQRSYFRLMFTFRLRAML